ncbi:hypothetical protein BO82DRAFT_383300 [Aspergillus uvarum CBS 121591]|uniref:Protein kinase domain-containing protein n=1 Tax=Aspergillus uvarum CBS 121591 TaxID=1448315 RepID=A0A319D247_9EURO|nr:hypothetical protein BO82DRAFT_383300 [Aspergillus uvarum CBS 121591]PYH81978.1 hypothetical protein BO82DRAFT_383300 [Aspergillus uvarum CBS 121591]
MGPQGYCSLDLDSHDIVIQREFSRSEASTVLEVRICGKTTHYEAGHGFVPFFHGFIDRFDPSNFNQQLNCFKKDKFIPRAFLNCVNYFDDLFRYAVDGIKQIHKALIHHHDIYPKNMLAVSGSRIVWIDFGVAMKFQDMNIREKAYCEYEVELVKYTNCHNVQKNDTLQGLPPVTRYY